MILKESFIAGGRVGVYLPNHPGANNRGYILKSRYIMEQKMERLLLPKEIVHHKNGDKTDDSPENLELTNNNDHTKYHHKKNDISKRILDYNKMAFYIAQGFGYKRTAKILGYNVHSVKSAFRTIKKHLNKEKNI